jgi:TatD DNase family protein
MVDAHAHLDEDALAGFVDTLSQTDTQITVISNSVNPESSRRNIELGKACDKILPFVGMHPDYFQQNPESKGHLQETIEGISKLSGQSRGIGEIGLDPKYESFPEQEKLFREMLSLAEKTRLPSSIHNRNSVARILEILLTFSLKGSVLLHWFAGSEQELSQILDQGYFVSYGPSILASKRMRSLVEKTEINFLLPETDAPTPYRSLNRSISTPFLIASVVFEMSLIKNIPFPEMREKLQKNLERYLGTQTSLRV